MTHCDVCCQLIGYGEYKFPIDNGWRCGKCVHLTSKQIWWQNVGTYGILFTFFGFIMMMFVTNLLMLFDFISRHTK